MFYISTVYLKEKSLESCNIGIHGKLHGTEWHTVFLHRQSICDYKCPLHLPACGVLGARCAICRRNEKPKRVGGTEKELSRRSDARSRREKQSRCCRVRHFGGDERMWEIRVLEDMSWNMMTRCRKKTWWRVLSESVDFKGPFCK